MANIDLKQVADKIAEETPDPGDYVEMLAALPPSILEEMLNHLDAHDILMIRFGLLWLKCPECLKEEVLQEMRELRDEGGGHLH